MKHLSYSMHNLYKKDRLHPFLFMNDYDLNEDIKALIKAELSFFMSIGDQQVFEKIIENTDRRYKCTKICDEYLGVVYSNYVKIKSITCINNSFIDFDTKGSIIIKFDTQIQNKKMIFCVGHFYNYNDTERIIKLDGGGCIINII